MKLNKNNRTPTSVEDREPQDGPHVGVCVRCVCPHVCACVWCVCVVCVWYVCVGCVCVRVHGQYEIHEEL